MKYLTILLILTISCDEPETFICPNGVEMDDCGVCGGNNIDLDECGVCSGNGPNHECPTGELVCNPSDCNIQNPDEWFIDLNFLFEDNFCKSYNPLYLNTCSNYGGEDEFTCNIQPDSYGCYWIGTHNISTNTILYWHNSSNQDISIYTSNTDYYCSFTSESIVNNVDCSVYYDETSCVDESCEWIYNVAWDTYTETIPSNTSGYDFFFRQCDANNCGAFSYPTTEEFCAIINGEEKCGKIRVTN